MTEANARRHETKLFFMNEIIRQDTGKKVHPECAILKADRAF